MPPFNTRCIANPSKHSVKCTLIDHRLNLLTCIQENLMTHTDNRNSIKPLVFAIITGLAASAVLVLTAGETLAGDDGHAPTMTPQRNPSGFAATYSTAGSIDTKNPFFQSLGTNGRSCATCHQQSEGWTVTPVGIRARFHATGGTDPIFRLNDGANSPNADVSTIAARYMAYSMLLNKGLIRVGIGMPANAEFELVKVEDPYGFASAKELSLFRRPLPTTNLKFLSTVMWDARETFKDANSTDCILGTSNCFASLHFNLSDQSNSATQGHAQAPQPLTQTQREAIVAFEMTLFTAQIFDHDAKRLTAHGAKGGPKHASHQPFYFGINDVVDGDYRTHAPFNPNVFTLYVAWNRAHVGNEADDDERDERNVARARQAVARGEALFNSKPINITGVKGLNDDLRVPTLRGTCTTCHDTPGAGNHSIPAPLDIGLTDARRRTSDMPLYTLKNIQTGEVMQTTDPGRALHTGKWKDIGRFKGPILRALAARAPYFHNGMAKDLDEAVDFYNTRFGISFTDDEKTDLVAFLKTL
jgi:cytochrome c peroxidase